MALSFADASGCKKVWEEITHAQHNKSNNHSTSVADIEYAAGGSYGRGGAAAGGYFGASYDDVDVNGDDGPFRPYGTDLPMETAILGDDERHGGVQQFFSLPSPDRGSLEVILRLVNENANIGSTRDKILSEVSRGGKYVFIDGLLDTFRKCEDLEDIEGLQALYRIFRGLFLLADPDLLRVLLSDDRIMDVIGVLEYDPDYYSTSVSNGEGLLHRHREFLMKKVEFKEVIPIRNATIVAQIHQNYRISYLKDVILPRSLDDGTFAALSHLIFKNNNDIVMYFISDGSALKELFAKLQSTDAGQKRARVNGMSFLVELCSLAKSLVCSNRDRFHEMLIEFGLFGICEASLRSEDGEIQLLGTELLSAALLQNQSSVRSYILSQEAPDSMLSTLVDRLNPEIDTGVLLQIFEILRTLLDPDSIASETEKSNFVDFFYENFVQRLLIPLQGAEDGFKSSRVLKSYISDFFSFCVISHGFRAKYFILRNNVVSKVLELLKTKATFVAISALRFFRSCVGVKDHFYNRYIVKNRLLEPIVKVFAANGNKDNLLNSSILELVDFITKENVKDLLAELVESYETEFQSIAQSSVFLDAKKVYLDNLKVEEASTGMTHASGDGSDIHDRRRGISSRHSPSQPAPDLDEDEAYFESDDGDDGNETMVGPCSPPPPCIISSAPPAAEEGNSPAMDEGETDVTASSTDKTSSMQKSVSPGMQAEAVVDSSTRPFPVKPLVDYPIEEDDDGADTASPFQARSRPWVQMTMSVEGGEVKSSLNEDADERETEKAKGDWVEDSTELVLKKGRDNESDKDDKDGENEEDRNGENENDRHDKVENDQRADDEEHREDSTSRGTKRRKTEDGDEEKEHIQESTADKG